MLHVPGHLLGANQHAFNLGIIGRGEIRTSISENIQAGAAEKLQGSFLRTALGHTQTNFHLVAPENSGDGDKLSITRLSVKQDPVPRWQISPSPSIRTRSSKV